MTGRPRAPARPSASDDQGAAALLTTGVGLLLTALLCAALPTAAGIATTGVRARTAADAVALAVLAGSPLAGGPHLGVDDPGDDDLGDDVGARVAAANGARLVGIDREGWPTGVVASVEVRAPGALGGVLPPIRASAAARLEAP